MKKLFLLINFILLTFSWQLAAAQVRAKNTIAASKISNTPPNFIDAISFTPDGITQKTDTRSIPQAVNQEAAPDKAAANKPEEPSFIEKLTGLQFKYAMMLNVEVESLKNLTLFGFIDNWFGTKYRMGGSTKTGIDCSALTSSLFLAVYGLAIPRTAKDQYKTTRHIKKNDLQEGDLVFFHTTRRGVSHVGLYLANNYFLHASTAHGVTISSLDDNYYSRHFICGGRM